MNANKKEIREYMKQEVADHIDWKTLEVNATTLAEDACQHFQDYEEDDSIDQTYYDIAYEVAIAKEKELGKNV